MCQVEDTKSVVVVVLKKACYVPKNSLCGLINNILMQYDFLYSLVMSLCESVPAMGEVTASLL